VPHPISSFLYVKQRATHFIIGHSLLRGTLQSHVMHPFSSILYPRAHSLAHIGIAHATFTPAPFMMLSPVAELLQRHVVQPRSSFK
jgi:hypothetical protein